MWSSAVLVFLTGTLASALVPGPDPPSPITPAPTGTVCPITNQHTFLVGRDHGCEHDPSREICIYDAILTLPCGCTRANITNPTTTQCATADGQLMCQTNYMYQVPATTCTLR